MCRTLLQSSERIYRIFQQCLSYIVSEHRNQQPFLYRQLRLISAPDSTSFPNENPYLSDTFLSLALARIYCSHSRARSLLNSFYALQKLPAIILHITRVPGFCIIIWHVSSSAELSYCLLSCPSSWLKPAPGSAQSIPTQPAAAGPVLFAIVTALIVSSSF